MFPDITARICDTEQEQDFPQINTRKSPYINLTIYESSTWKSPGSDCLSHLPTYNVSDALALLKLSPGCVAVRIFLRALHF